MKKLDLIIVLIVIATIAVAIALKDNFEYGQHEGLATSKFLASTYDSMNNYSEALTGLPNYMSRPQIRAGIISHHFLASRLIAEFYNEVSRKDASIIFLISPDHYRNFFPAGVVAYTSKLPWETPFGNLLPNEKIIDALVKDGKVATSNSIVGLEHGIYIEVPFIRLFNPGAEIVPLAVNLSASFNDFAILGNELRNISDNKAVLIVSSDFSHGLSAEKSVEADKKSISILEGLPAGSINGINSDCRQCMAVLSGFLSDGNKYSFHLIDNKNSADFSNPEEDTVTSYVSGYYIENK